MAYFACYLEEQQLYCAEPSIGGEATACSPGCFRLGRQQAHRRHIAVSPQIQYLPETLTHLRMKMIRFIAPALLAVVIAVVATDANSCDLSGIWADNSERGFVLRQHGLSLKVFEMQFNSTVPGGVSHDCTSVWTVFSGAGNQSAAIGRSQRNMTWSDGTPWTKRAPRHLRMNVTTYLDGGCSTRLAAYVFAPNVCFTTPVGISFMGQCSEIVGKPYTWTWMVSSFPVAGCNGTDGGVSWYGGQGGQCGPMGYLGGMSAWCSIVRGDEE